MIDWTKRIQTVDGRKAKVLTSITPVGSDDPAGWAVYVAAPPGGVFGHVFLVDGQGFRCDDDAPIQRQQIIRNARVKREGWVLKGERINRLSDYRVFETEKDAREAIISDEIIARMEWEE